MTKREMPEPFSLPSLHSSTDLQVFNQMQPMFPPMNAGNARFPVVYPYQNFPSSLFTQSASMPFHHTQASLAAPDMHIPMSTQSVLQQPPPTPLQNFGPRPSTANSMMSGDSDTELAKSREETARLHEEMDKLKHEVLDLKVQREMDALEKQTLYAKIAKKDEHIEFLEVKCHYVEQIYASTKKRVDGKDVEVEELTKKLALTEELLQQLRQEQQQQQKRHNSPSGSSADPIDLTVASPLPSCSTVSSPVLEVTTPSTRTTSTMETTTTTYDAPVLTPKPLVVEEAVMPILEDATSNDDAVVGTEDAVDTPSKTFEQICAEWATRSEKYDIMRGIDVTDYVFNPSGARESPQTVRKVQNAFTLFTGNRLSLNKTSGLRLSNHNEAWLLLDAAEKRDWRDKWHKLIEVQTEQVQLGFVAISKDRKKRPKVASTTAATSSKKPRDEQQA